MSSWFLTLLWPKGESSIRKVTISDHFLDFTDINLKSPKQAPTYVVTSSFCNYKPYQFATDITHIPSDTVNLRDSVDDRLDAFNELFFTCLENHAPLRTVKIWHKPNPFITRDIRHMMKEGDCLHQTVRKMGTKEDWKAFRELRNGWKWRYERQNRNTLTRKFTKKRTTAGQFGKPMKHSAKQDRSHKLHPKTQNDTLANEFSHFLKSVGEKAACDSANLPGRTTYQTSQSLLIFVHHRPLTSCWNSMQ